MSEPAARKRHSLEAYLRPRTLIMLALGFSSGLPFLLTGNTFGFWLRDEGTTLTVIGFISWVGLAYSLQFVWAPLVDRCDVPVLSRLGRRRSWMVFAQILVALGLVAMAMTGPHKSLALLGTFALLVAFASSTQDIVINAWRIDTAEDGEELGLLASAYQFGYRVALLATDAWILAVAQRWGWPLSYTAYGGLMAIGLIATFAATEPARAATAFRPLLPESLTVGPVRANLAGAGLIAASLAALQISWFGISVFMYLLAGAALVVSRKRIFVGVVLIGAAILLYFSARAFGLDVLAASLRQIRSAAASPICMVLCLMFLAGAGLSFMRYIVLARWANFALFTIAVIVFVGGVFGFLPFSNMLPVWLSAFAAVMTAPPRIFDAIAGPFIAFFRHYGSLALLMLTAIALYRLPDFVMGPMANPFYHDIGLTKDTVAAVRTSFGLVAAFAGIAAGGFIALRFGYMRALILGGILQAVAIAAFAILSRTGGDGAWFSAVMVGDNFGTAFAGVALVTYMSTLTSQGYTATQYALLSSSYALIGKVLKGFSGAVVDGLNAHVGLMDAYAVFFAGAGLIGLPAIVLFLLLDSKQRALKRATEPA
jgi:PAT family beta-lactamase induction signal transducer AmpG